ncbi:hypothetical protein GRI89_13660 [Altererythrobacter salegens]|uniref:TonB C-terminal domain-containing protein n=1 Tax=Croceibacterium salegens TaxID=1737568 RepID=A0A6I4SZX4_9SPHN|nr:hypothetical protein [Croceibacterium salegens]MXO60587.1 hypothetical protein [Croceibacterium salegens]
MGFGRIATGSMISAALLATAPAASAGETLVFKPTGQWALDYGDDYCRLSRNFSDGTNEMAVAFERIQPGPTMRLILVGKGMRTYRSADELGWDFTPATSGRKARFTRAEMVGGNDYFNLGPVTIAALAPPAPGAPPMPPAYDRSEEKAAAKPLTGILLSSGLVDPVEIDTGSLGDAVGALQACADDLAKTWGLDPARMGKGSTPAIPDGGGVGWLPQGTVPFTEFSKLAGGSNQIRLMVDESGKATECKLHWATLDTAVNEKICSILMDKAHFAPAKDPDGKAMAGMWIGSPMFLGPAFPGGGRGR